MLMDLTLGNLQHLDGGKAAVTFADQVKTVAKDCYDRAGDKTARVITITVAVKPRADQHGNLQYVDTTIDVKTKLPDIKSNIYQMKAKIEATGSKGLQFHPDLPSDPDGRSIMDIADLEGNE